MMPEMITLLYSSDATMTRYAALLSIHKTFPVRDEFNYVRFNMAETRLNELADECNFIPLGTDRKCVLASDCAFLAKSKTKYKLAEGDSFDRLLAYFQSPSEFVDLYLLVKGEIDPKNELVKAIKNTGTIKEILLPSEDELAEKATRYFASKGAGIEPEAAREIAKRVGVDYGRFMNELPKLLNYANGEQVRLESVKLLVAPKEEDDTFALSNALVRGDVKKAMAIYRDLKAHSLEEVRLINMLANQFVFLDEVRYLDAKGLSSQQIASELTTSPKRVEISLRNMYRIKPDVFPRILEELYVCEKAILTGQSDGEFAFMRFLANYDIA